MNSKKTTITVSEIIKQKIMDELVEPCFYKDIKALMSERTIWRKSGNIFETFSKLFIGASSILSFATGLNFWSGTSSVLSLVCMQFSSFSHSESKERSNKMNKLLDKLKVENVPDISSQNNNPQAASFRSSYYSGYNQQPSQYGDTYYSQPRPYPLPYSQPQEPLPYPQEPLPYPFRSRKNSFEDLKNKRNEDLELQRKNSFEHQRKNSFDQEDLDPRHSRKNSLDKKDQEIEDLKNKRKEDLEREEVLKKVEALDIINNFDLQV